MPNVVLEAMALGRPVVGTRVGGVPELIVDGETGLLVPPRDESALASAISALLLDGERRRAMGASARRRAQERFSVEAMVSATEAVYDAVLEGHASARGSAPTMAR
jgi:glycosyltransferase involved in cell wall biosynthesis